MNESYAPWFQSRTGNLPHEWQTTLASASGITNRLIRIPTGFGKTAGVVMAWWWNRLERQDQSWPNRLVICLPMRVLVEQTEATIGTWLAHAGLLWDWQKDPTSSHVGKVGVHVLMGGSNAGDWHLNPEHPAILIGTQDLLLSRALNRGYAAPRGRWPMEFGLLNQDCLWVLDEIQLMDVGLATSAQLQAFRTQNSATAQRPCHSWWMSATLQPGWLATIDTGPMLATLPPPLEIAPAARVGTLWDVRKPVTIAPATESSAIAALVRDAHRPGTQTLVVVNRVDTAVEVFKALKPLAAQGVDLRLVHSRFRPAERTAWRSEFLHRQAPRPEAGRIIVATQVVEAGVDLSADTLVTALAPWPSLVQRFGRCARYGGEGRVIVADPGLSVDDGKTAAPYAPADLLAAREALSQISDVAPAGLETFEASLTPDARRHLYPYMPPHLLLRRELDELFDTTTDLTGADLDISRFIRSGDERDCLVWWHPVAGAGQPPATLQPAREALCAVPFHRMGKWLFDTAKKLKGDAWAWDFLAGEWQKLEPKDCRPGRVILVDVTVGGYDPLLGFTGDARKPKDLLIPIVNAPIVSREDQADQAQDGEYLSALDGWQTIATHGGWVGEGARDVARALGLTSAMADLLHLAGRLHDWGKVHPAFQVCLKPDAAPAALAMAKAPQSAWVGKTQMYDLTATGQGRRKGFRHELASTLALFELLARRDPRHPALLGACSEFIALGLITPVSDVSDPVSGALADELAALCPADFDLVAYLICSHHGKIRISWHAAPDDQEFTTTDDLGMPLRGVRNGDGLPALPLRSADGSTADVPALTLHLDPANLGLNGRYGRSWRERTADLQTRHGPFAIALLEACLRTADIRASQHVARDPLLETLP